MKPIAVAGHLCVDLTPELPAGIGLDPGHLIEVGPLRMSIGGAVGNIGRELHRLGLPVLLSATVGDDALAGYVRTTLTELGEPTDGIVTAAGTSTSYSLVLEPPETDRTFWHSVGANATFDGTGVDLSAIDLLALGYPPLLPALLRDGGVPLRDLLRRAQDAGVTTVLDLCVVDPQASVGALNWADLLDTWLPFVDVFCPSIDDLQSALRTNEPVEQLLDRVIDSGAAVAVLTAGSDGMFIRTAPGERFAHAGRALAGAAYTWANQSLIMPPVWRTAPVTTNGAGDAATAGLLFGIAHGFGLEAAAAWAAACAGVIVSGQRLSVQSAIDLVPTLERP